MTTHFYNGKILRNHQLESSELWIANGKIVGPQKEVEESINLQGKIIAPGFIDLQVNGIKDWDLTSAPETITSISKHLVKYGVTSFLATLVSSTPEHYQKALPVLQKHIGKTPGAELVGIHLEGPCFNPQQSKAHSSNKILSCKEFTTPEFVYGDMQGVRIVTIAPEIPGALNWISWLANRGIVASAGHTMATVEQMNRGIEAGITMATHLFNGMAPLHHRSPGVIGAVLNRPEFFYSIIADGVHIDPLVLSFAWRCQSKGLILISDAIATHQLAGSVIHNENKKAYIEGTNIMAGCTENFDQLIRNFRKYTHASIVEALEAASFKPAKAIGIYPNKGSLNMNADADLVIIDDDLKVHACYVAGLK